MQKALFLDIVCPYCGKINRIGRFDPFVLLFGHEWCPHIIVEGTDTVLSVVWNEHPSLSAVGGFRHD